MPIHEFVCQDCDNQFEEIILGDEKPKCPKCASEKITKLLSAGSVRPHGIPTGGGGWKPPKCKGGASGG